MGQFPDTSFPAGGIETITSTGATLTIANPNGPVTDLEVSGTVTGAVHINYVGAATDLVLTEKQSTDTNYRLAQQAQGLLGLFNAVAPPIWGVHNSGDIGAGSDFAFTLESNSAVAYQQKIHMPRVYLNNGTQFLHLQANPWTGSTLNATLQIQVDVGTIAALPSSGNMNVSSAAFGTGVISYTGVTGSGVTGTLTGCAIVSGTLSPTFTDAFERFAWGAFDSYDAPLGFLGSLFGFRCDRLTFQNGFTADNVNNISLGFTNVSTRTGSAIIFGADNTTWLTRSGSATPELDVNISGTVYLAINAAGTTVNNQLVVAEGTAAAPAIANGSFLGSGINFNTVAGNPVTDLVFGGAVVVRSQSTQLFPITDNAFNLGTTALRFQKTYSVLFGAGNGSAALPSLTFAADTSGTAGAPGSGLYLVASGTLGIAAGGVSVATATSGGLTLANGAAATTQAATDNSTKLATTAFVATAVANALIAKANNDLLVSSFDPALNTTASALAAAATVYFARVPLLETMTITNVLVELGGVGATLTNSFVAVWQSNGTIVGQSADQSSSWGTGGTGGVKTVALASGPFTVNPLAANDFLWVGIYVGTTTGALPSFAALTTSSTGNAGCTTARTRFGSFAIANTSTLTNLTPGSLVQTSASNRWVALS